MVIDAGVAASQVDIDATDLFGIIFPYRNIETGYSMKYVIFDPCHNDIFRQPDFLSVIYLYRKVIIRYLHITMA
jgi:hypothetical protein